MKVLSLFDGISCARVALERAGIAVEAYYASEIDKYAIAISKKNYPDIIQLGSVTEVRVREPEDEFLHSACISPSWKIDLMIGGSPCQDLSIAKLKRTGLQGEKSNLFYEYVRILKEVKPKYWILENVASMKKDQQEIISEILGVKPIMIDAGLLSAQTRKRLFWTNIPGIKLPEDEGLVLKDIMIKGEVDSKYWYHYPLKKLGEDKGVCAIMQFNNNEMHKRIHNPLFKCPTLTTCRGGGLQKKVLQNGNARKLTPLEYERLQGLPDNYTHSFADSHRYNTIGNAFNVDVIAHILSFIPK